MQHETKRKIVKVVAGTAIAAAITLGVAFGGPAIKDAIKAVKDAIQYENTQIVYNESNYKLENLYILSNEDGKELCYQTAIDSKMETDVRIGIAMDNGMIMGMDGSVGFQIGGNYDSGIMVVGMPTKIKTTYGYITLDTNKLIAIRGLENQFGYSVEKVKAFIPFETAKENGFQFSEEEFNNFMPMTNGKSK